MDVSFAYEVSLSYSAGSLTRRKILRHGTDRFTSLQKEVVLWFLSPLNIHRHRPGFEPANLGSSGKHYNHYTTEATIYLAIN
jgi:hypothetical protein